MTSLFEWRPGSDAQEPKRLGRQLAAVHRHMTQGDREWWTFAQLRAALNAEGIGIDHPGLSARIRELRRPEYGGYTVDRIATPVKGVYAYRCRRSE